jgi:hypothetical protein
MFTLIPWDYIYGLLGVRDFIYFISSPSIQEALLPVKIVFIFFTVAFFIAVIWFYMNSSYIQYKFLQDTVEFLSRDTYGLRKINNDWRKIRRRADSGSESELKLAIIDADDFLYQTLQEMDYKGDTFEDLITDAGKKVSAHLQEILDAHATRNSIVYEPNFKINAEAAKRILLVYENAIKDLSIA